jgi:hypothetical protein
MTQIKMEKSADKLVRCIIRKFPEKLDWLKAGAPTSDNFYRSQIQ